MTEVVAKPPEPPSRRRRWLRRLRNVAGALVILLIIARIVLLPVVGSVARSRAKAVGLSCTWDRLDLSLLSGELELSHLAIAPLEGGEPILALGSLRADIETSSLLGGLHVRRVDVDGLELAIDRDADGELAIVKRIRAASPPGPPDEKKPETTEEKKKSERPIVIEALRVEHLHARFRDAAVSPPLDARLDLDLRVSDLVLHAPARHPAKVELVVACPPVLDGLRVEGVATPANGATVASLSVALDRLRLGPIAGYLRPLGIEPAARELSFALDASARAGATTTATLTAKLTGDGDELLGLDRVAFDARSLDPLEGASVVVEGLRARATHLADGGLRAGGIILRKSGAAGPPAPVELAARLDSLRLDGLDASHPDSRATLAARFASPGLVDAIAIVGSFSPFAAERSVDLALSVEGLAPRAARPYLEAAGMESTFSRGSLGLTLHATAKKVDTVTHASLALKDLALRDGSELAALDLLRVSGAQIASGSIAIDEVEVAGPRVHARREASGALVALGLRVKPGPRPPKPAPFPAAPLPSSPRSAVGGDSAPPRFALGKLRLHDVRATFDDDSFTPRASLALDAGLNLDAVAFDPDPQKVPQPARLRAWASAPGIVEDVAVVGSFVASPARPSLGLVLTAKKLTARAAGPYLAAAGITPRLRDGSLALSVLASASIAKGGPLAASASVETLRVADGPDELFRLDGLRLVDARLLPSPAKLERVEVAKLELDKLATTAALESGAVAALGLAIAPRPSAAPIVSATPAVPTSASPPALSLGQLRIGEVAVDLHDRVRGQDLPIRVAVDVGALAFDPRALGAETPFAVKVAVPGALDALLAGGLAVGGREARVHAGLGVSGIRGDFFRPALRAAGIEPLLRAGKLGCELSARAATEGSNLVAEASLEKLAVEDAGDELAGIDAIRIRGARLRPARLAVDAIEVVRPRARARRDGAGALIAGGLRIPPRAPAPEAPPEPRATPPRAFEVDVGALHVRDVEAAWADASVSPVTSLRAVVGVDVERLVLGKPAPPAKVHVGARISGALDALALDGTVSPDPDALAVALGLDVRGLRAGPLAPYLPPGMKLVLEDGRLRASLAANVTRAGDSRSVRLSLSQVDYRDGATELFRLGEVRVSIPRLEPSRIAIDDVSVLGIATSAEKTPSGELRLLGLALDPTDHAPAKPAPPPAAKTKRESSPLVQLARVHLNVERFSFADRSQRGSTPLVVSQLHVENPRPIELLGPDPTARPPIELALRTSVAPIASAIVVTARLAPFAQEPEVAIDLAIRGLRGAGLTEVSPALASRLDGSKLTDGHVHVALDVDLRTERRDPTDFSALGQRFGALVALHDVEVRNGEGPVLAGVKAIHADVARIDSSGNVVVRALEVVRPAGLVANEANGMNVLDLLIKTPPKSEAPPPPPPPRTPRASEVRVDRLIVSDIAFAFEDRSCEPKLTVPLVGLDVEVVGFTTRALEEQRSIRFEASLTGGKVALPKREKHDAIPGMSLLSGAFERVADMAMNEKPREPVIESRPFLRELSVQGDLALAPNLFGKVRTSVVGLELETFLGPARAAGVKKLDGVFDLESDATFDSSGNLASSNDVSFTDLDVVEPANGPISRFLILPAPLDVVLFALRDEDGAIQFPLPVAVDAKDGITAGSIWTAARTALLGIIVNALKAVPQRMLGSFGDLGKSALGVVPGSDLVPFLSPPPVHEPATLAFAPGDIALVGSQVGGLETIARELADDEKLGVALRHDLGGGDLARERIVANPDGADRRDLIASLAARREDLDHRRIDAAAETRAALDASHDASAPRAKVAALEAELARVDRALDVVYDQERDGADRQADRRTRAACLELARARIEATKKALVARGVDPERIRITRPRFEESPGDGGGRVTLTVSARRKNDRER